MKSGMSKGKVLIIDDVKANIKILNDVIKSEYEVVFATNGREGIQTAMMENPPDLILLDVMMPEIDGYDVCKILKDDSMTKKIPVIFITSLSEAESEAKGFELGAVDYITKPFNPDIVRARVQTHVELKQYRDYLENQTFRDGLTGIPNRRRFDEYLASTWDFECRNSAELSLIMIDIDHFKNYNDNYGHLQGDECLKKVAQTLEACLRRKIDLIARYGGEEFGCILPSTDLNGAANIAEMFRKTILSLKIPHDYSTAEKYITISQGVASLPPSWNLSRNVIIKSADEALYKAKKNGRNMVCTADPLCQS